MMQRFLNEPSDVTWLIEGHLRNMRLDFTPRSSVIYGNEDCPLRIELWGEHEPYYYVPPKAVYVLNDDGEYEGIAP